MNLPYFFLETLHREPDTFTLSEETSKHVIQVLRMKAGEHLQLTNGKGYLMKAEITDDNRKKCIVRKVSAEQIRQAEKKITIAISPLKNTSRFEWFLEKATEMGVSEIIPLLCQRTEKQHHRIDRLNNILVSAMLQSKQSWLPLLHEPTRFESVIRLYSSVQKLIAHCEDDDNKKQLAGLKKENSVIILIGPEGDFTPEEVSFAKDSHFVPVALGDTRLRTETAGVFAAALLCS